jgi:hypothetical protein
MVYDVVMGGRSAGNMTINSKSENNMKMMVKAAEYMLHKPRFDISVFTLT